MVKLLTRNLAYRLTGFDASAHLSEETRKASWSAPIGVVSSVGFSSLFGFFVVLTYLFSIQDFDRTISSQYGQPVLQIFVDIAGEDGALAMFSVIIGELTGRGVKPRTPSANKGHDG